MELTTIDTNATRENSEAQEALTLTETKAVHAASVDVVPESARPVAVRSHRIDLEPAYRTDPETGRSTGHGKAVMIYEGEVIGSSREPAFAAARWLLKRGLALPSDRLTTYRDNSPCIFTGVGRAAKLTLREDEKGGIRTVAYREVSAEALAGLSGDGERIIA
ncbi:hypothetical protein AMST5_02904 [freshwater sediment metagenome]|uniref:Uncharacterized protein n=1 Tax=freshwater sediment metagenome TaxID=556182 RepID=A0AA48M2U2_9ZZZZ